MKRELRFWGNYMLRGVSLLLSMNLVAGAYATAGERPWYFPIALGAVLAVYLLASDRGER